MQQYIATMNKYEPAYTYNGVAFQGWQSAVLLADGIKAAGSDLTQANVIAQDNKITNFTADGRHRTGGLDDRPHGQHAADLQRLRAGAGDHVRPGARHG